MATVQTGSVLERSVLKEGQIFLVADRAGDVKQLNFMSNLQFANDTLLGPTGEIIAEPRTISIRRNRFLYGDGLHERLGLLNYNQHPVQLTVRITFGSDFRDMFEVRGYFPDDSGVALGEMKPIEVLPDGVRLGYRGSDGVERYTQITFDPNPDTIEIVNPQLRRLGSAEALPGLVQWNDPREEGRVVPPIAAAVFKIDLPSMQPRPITVHIAPEADDAPSPATARN